MGSAAATAREAGAAGAPVPAPARRIRAGRNLQAAIAVGLALGLALILTLYLFRPAFVALVVVAIGAGARELVLAVRRVGVRPPMLPLVVGGMLTAGIGYPAGRYGVFACALASAVVAAVWRAVFPPADGTRSLRVDVVASAFIVLYVGFLAAFAVLLATPSDGPRRVTAFIVTVVCSDIGAYASGVLSGGRHKLAPRISPGKSVEGLVGGSLVCVVSGVVFYAAVLHSHWWGGVLFGLAMVVTATFGDLAESALKRDIGIKDMGALLPGHGGILDRIDSLLLSAPVAWLLLTAMVHVR